MKPEEQLVLLEKIVELMEQQMGSNVEIVLHDLRRPYDSTIVDIRNGHITGREIGGCVTNRGLEVIRGTVKNGDEFNYITRLPDGKILRSSSVYFRDEEEKVFASLCINQDITDTLRMENMLRDMNKYSVSVPAPEEKQGEVFAGSISELLEKLIDESRRYIGKPLSDMNRQEKMEVVRFLDEKGVFLITHSGERVCEVLDISKFTLYNYLNMGRRETADSDHSDES